MKSCKTIAELRLQFEEVHSGVAGDTIFGAKALMFIAEILSAQKSKPKRKPSKWQIFLGKSLKSGKTIQQAASDWKGKACKRSAT
jgi:hypothetical protein